MVESIRVGGTSQKGEQVHFLDPLVAVFFDLFICEKI